MKAIATVARKEILETARDRRTLLSLLLAYLCHALARVNARDALRVDGGSWCVWCVRAA